MGIFGLNFKIIPGIGRKDFFWKRSLFNFCVVRQIPKLLSTDSVAGFECYFVTNAYIAAIHIFSEFSHFSITFQNNTIHSIDECGWWQQKEHTGQISRVESVMFLRALRLLGPTQPHPWMDAPLILLLSHLSSTAQDGDAGAARHFQSKIQT